MTKFTEDILASGHMGCIVRVAEVIARLNMKSDEEAFVKGLITSLHIPEDKIEESFCKLVISMMTHDMFFKTSGSSSAAAKLFGDDTLETADSAAKKEDFVLKNDSINYHGACLLKSCLSFIKCDTAVNSFIALTREELATLACHPAGNHVFESFLSNDHVKRKTKNLLSDKMGGKFAVMAADKFGSRVVEAFWRTVGDQSKDVIKKELTQNKSKLECDLYGRIVLYNCEITQQARKMREIKEQQERKRKMFKDILPPTDKKDTNDVGSAKKSEKGGEHNPVKEEKHHDDQPPLKKAKGKNQSNYLAFWKMIVFG